MVLRIYDTLTREKREFAPQDPARVTMYVCGPTVYNFAHIGNARPVVVFDLLFRLLSLRYPNVVYARNITDVDDKIMKAAAEQGVPIAEITEHFARVYQEDMRSLGALDPTLQPRVTENLDAILAMIGRLVESGHAYAAEGHVLFDVTAYSEYGALSRRKRDEMLAGARVEVAPYKRDPGDFVLWKPSADDQPGWDSPWGRGRPGWHIECSAMSEAHLGETIDIHAGGQDLIFPHHENEIAQSVCSHGGRTYARYWMHNGFLTVEQSKMSKSLGNFVTVHELLEHHPGEALRLALMSGHYRAPLDWNEEGIQQARRSLDRLYRALRDLGDVAPDPAADEPEPELVAALEDDLNTPQALAALFPLAKAAHGSSDPAERARLKARLLASGRLLGILQRDPAEWFSAAGEGDLPAAAIDALVAARNAARAAKDWSEADRIRDELAAAGVTIEDGPEGTLWSRG